MIQKHRRTQTLTTATKPPTKTEILTEIADAAGLTKKEVAAVFDALNDNIKKNLGRRGPGAYTIPGLLKIEKKRVPARKAQQGVPNPFKPGELMDVAARPASNKVKGAAAKEPERHGLSSQLQCHNRSIAVRMESGCVMFCLRTTNHTKDTNIRADRSIRSNSCYSCDSWFFRGD